MIKNILTLVEACEYLDISRSYMYKLTSGRKIPHSCPGGKKIYFDQSDLDNWALQNKRKTEEEYENEAYEYVQF